MVLLSFGRCKSGLSDEELEAWSLGVGRKRRLRSGEASGEFERGTSSLEWTRRAVVEAPGKRRVGFRREKSEAETEATSSVELQQERTLRLVQD